VGDCRGERKPIAVDDKDRRSRDCRHRLSRGSAAPEILDSEILSEIRMIENTQVPSTRFETSVSGLFFVEPVAANCFGPLMRFACGNRFVARRLAPFIASRTAQ
jgi:hypothetical protein